MDHLLTRGLKRRTRPGFRSIASVVLATTALSGRGDVTEAPAPEAQPLPVPTYSFDTDLDGLSDAQEYVLGTKFDNPDSDGDGFSDSEELARASNPANAAMIPEGGDVSVGMTANVELGALHLVTAIWRPAEVPEEEVLQFGALAGGRSVSLPMSWLLSRSTVERFTTARGQLTILDFAIDQQLVHNVGRLTFFAAVGVRGEGSFRHATKIEINVEAHRLMLAVPSRMVPSSVLQGGGLQGGTMPGGFHRPITGGTGWEPSDPPIDAHPAQVCYREAEVVGSNGAMITQEIVEAECIDGWDSWCSADCANAVGRTYTTIDPLSLVGG